METIKNKMKDEYRAIEAATFIYLALNCRKDNST